MNNPAHDLPEWLRQRYDEVCAEITTESLHPMLRSAGIADPEKYKFVVAPDLLVEAVPSSP